MTSLEAASLAVALLYATLRAALDPRPGVVALRLLAILGAAVLAELAVVGFYGFYSFTIYPWKLVISAGPADVPLAVPMIWPVVVHSAWDLARRIRTSRTVTAVAGLTAFLVLTDAALIEPIAVHFGMWHWHEPGVFGPDYAVPPIGIIGWAVFAFGVAVLLERWERSPEPDVKKHAGRALALVAIAPVIVHPPLMVLWWGALRWLSVDLPAWPAAVTAWAVSCALTALALRADRGTSWQVLACIPGAVFFFGLLALSGNAAVPLMVWSAAITPPYLALLTRGRKTPGSPARA